jgi:hypothetical protein
MAPDLSAGGEAVGSDPNQFEFSPWIIMLCCGKAALVNAGSEARAYLQTLLLEVGTAPPLDVPPDA